MQRGVPVICSVGVLQGSDPSCGVQQGCLQPAPLPICVLGDHKPCSQSIYVFPKKSPTCTKLPHSTLKRVLKAANDKAASKVKAILWDQAIMCFHV